MKRRKYKNYVEYIQAQRMVAERRTPGPFFTDLEIRTIAGWVRRRWGEARRIICHGARAGHEVIEFQKHFSNAIITGTDLFPVEHTYAGVIKHDFSVPVPEWQGQMDIVYSNSLDHARDPVQTLRTWMNQLRPDGHLFVQWSKAHRTLGVADCFGASLNEYMDIIEETGRLVDLLLIRTPKKFSNPLRRRGCRVVVLVATKNTKD